MARLATLLVPCAVLAAVGCGGSNLLLGRVTAEVAGHPVVVTDCYRTSAPPPERLPDDAGLPVWRYAPCRDAVLLLRGADLEVNGRGYGALRDGDEVLVDHGKVSIHRSSGAP